jgi:putative transposase
MSFLADVLKAIRIGTAYRVFLDFLRMLALTCRRRSAVEAQNLFLRKQLALFQESKTKPRLADDPPAGS